MTKTDVATGGTRSVLVIDSNRKQLGWITRIVRTVAPDAAAVERLDDLSAIDGRAVVVANYDGLSERERTRLFDATAGVRLVLLSAGAQGYHDLIPNLVAHGVANLVALNGAKRSADLAITLHKLLGGDIFGLDKYFGWGVNLEAVTITSSADAKPFVDRVTRRAQELDIHPRLIDQLALVADELVSNALYNAPVDTSGRPRFAHLKRTTSVALGPGEQISARIGCDGTLFGLSVADSFGTLTRTHCLDYLVKGLRREVAPPAAEKGGAGLGLYLTFDSLNQLAVNIWAGQSTEVIGLIDVSGSYKDFCAKGKSFNLFLAPRDES